MDYIAGLESLHDVGRSPGALHVLESIAQDPEAVNDTVIDALPPQRREAVRSVRTRLRAAGFRDRVLAAYGHRCSVCGLQLGLVQSAHIVPVSYAGSTDETRNGLALCALHHAAYDTAIIGVHDDYRVMLNETRLAQLQTTGRDAGKQAFVASLRQVIVLPVTVGDRPHTQYLKVGNAARGWDLFLKVFV